MSTLMKDVRLLIIVLAIASTLGTAGYFYFKNNILKDAVLETVKQANTNMLKRDKVDGKVEQYTTYDLCRSLNGLRTECK